MCRFRNLSALIFAVLLCVMPAHSQELNPTGYMLNPARMIDTYDDPPEFPHSLNDTTLPISYDLRQNGGFPGIRNQNPHGTCWAFSSIGSLESAYHMKYPSEDIDLSEMHLAYFAYGDTRPGKSFNIVRDAPLLSQAGNIDMAVAFLSKAGTVSESVLPYSNTKPAGFPENYKPAGIRLKDANYFNSPQTNSENIKRFIMNTGGVSISYININSAYNKSDSGKTAYFTTSTNGNGHAGVIIGWDDEFPREDFPENMRPENNGAWLVRNSWGSSWTNESGQSAGEEGCFWMSYEQWMFDAVAFIPEKSDRGLKHYGYDDLGYCSTAAGAMYANVFRAEGNESLKYIGFYTVRSGTSYEISVYDLGTQSPDSPVNGTVIASITDGYQPYWGYHTVEISGNISAGHYFSVVMKSDKGFAREAKGTYTEPVCNPGETYCSSDGESWDECGYNVSIKAFTVPDPYANPELKLVEISPVNFPDEVFREYLRDFDLDDNGYFSAREISLVNIITLPKSGLHSLRGIEIFTSLQSLDVSGNHLTALDLHANNALTFLSCSGQNASGLVLTQNGDNYSANLRGYISGDIVRVIPESVKASAGDTVYHSDSGSAEFTALASSVSYGYDTGFSGQSMDVTAYVLWEDDSLVNIDGLNFPDDNFRAFIRKRYDTDKDGWLNERERSAKSMTVSVNFSGGKVASVKGIEFFPAMTKLDCSFHNITELDVSRNIDLDILICTGNKITALDVSSNKKLYDLECGRNLLTALDVSGNTALTKLLCGNNTLCSLDVSNNTALTNLACNSTGLSKLDITNNKALTILDCADNNLHALDISANAELLELYCYSNKLDALDISANTALLTLHCDGNMLKALDVSGCANLKSLRCENNCLAWLDLSGNTNLDGVQSKTQDGRVIAWVSYENQKRGGLNVTPLNGRYSVSLNDYVSDIARIEPSTIKDTAGESCSYNSESGVAMFDSWPAGVCYKYDTGYTKAESSASNYRYMDVTVMSDIVMEKPEIIADSKLPEAFVGTEYAYSMTVTGQPAPIVTAENLPDGLSVDKSGKISGTPKKAKTFTVTLTATNAAGSAEKSITLKVNSKRNLKITPNTLSVATWGKKYNKKFTASGLKNVTWNISGSLPDGITFDPVTAKLSGIPNEAGSFIFTLTAGNGGVIVRNEYTLIVKGVKPKLKGSMKAANAGKFYSVQLQASGTTPLMWNISGLPGGLSYDVNDDGTQCEISGIPSSGKREKISVTLRNAGGDLTKTFTLTVKYVKPKILTTSLPKGTQYSAYPGAKLEASGYQPVTWSWSGKKLPEGMNFSEDGTLSGTPSVYGNFSMRITAENPGGKVSKTFTLKIEKGNDDTRLPKFEHITYSDDDAEYQAGGDYWYVTVARLPAISVDESGIYEFTVSVDADVPEGSLVWRETPDSLNDSEDAIFLDDEGEVIDDVPESRVVTVDAWLEPGKVYEPVIMVKVSR